MTLGVHGKITADQARTLAKQVAGKIADGTDVAAEKRRTKVEKATAPTVAALADEWLERHVREKLKPKTVTAYEWVLAKKIVPTIGKLLVRDLKHADVSKMHHGLKDTKRTANHAVAILSSMLNWAIDQGYRPDRMNPCDRLKQFRTKKRQRFLTEAELARLGAALKRAETEGVPWDIDDDAPPSKHLSKNASDKRTKVCPFAAAAIRLLVFTGCRKSEILTLQWEFVDFNEKVLRLPEHKTDGDVGEKRVMLIPAALEVLSAMPRIDGNPFVICGRLPDTHRVDLKRPWDTLRMMADIQDVHLHDKRHTLASHGQAAGLSLELVGGLLGHRNVATTKQYAHLWDAPKRIASDRVGTRLANALNGVTPPSDKLIK